MIKHHKIASIGLATYIVIACDSTAQEHGTNSPKAFEDMLVEIYQRHPQLESERDELRILDERVNQANSGFRPTLSANAGYGKQRVKVAGRKWQYGDDRSKTLAINQSLFNGFGTIAEVRAAKERVEAGRAELLATEQEVFFAAISSWLDVCEKEKILILNRANYQRLSNYLNATQERFNAGDGTTTDVSLADSRLADAQAQLALAEAQRDVALAVYERNTGLIAEIGDYPTPPVELPLNQHEAISLAENNPDLKKAEHLQLATQHDVDSAASSLWPTVSLRGASNEERSTAFSLGKLRNDTLTVNVSIPLYQGGAEYSRVREAKIAREKSKQNMLDMSRDVVQRAKASWSNFNASIKVIQAAKRSAASAKKALNGINEEHAQGTRTLTEVLDAQSEVLAAQIAETQAHKNSRIEAYRLLASVGKLTVDGLHLPLANYDPKEHYDRTKNRWIGTSIDERPEQPQEPAQQPTLEMGAEPEPTTAPVAEPVVIKEISQNNSTEPTQVIAHIH